MSKTDTDAAGVELCVVSTPITVTEERARDLLVGAIEGGSNYWIDRIYYDLAPGLTTGDFREGGKLADPGGTYYHPSQLIPFVEGCALLLDNEHDPKVRLDRESMKRGFQVMAEKYPHHWRDFVAENDDATTSDVFLQCAVFGEVIFG